MSRPTLDEIGLNRRATRTASPKANGKHSMNAVTGIDRYPGRPA
jgi:hypothetical protein